MYKGGKKIREAINKMAMVEIRSLAINHGLSGSEDECDSGSDVEEANLEGISTEELKLSYSGKASVISLNSSLGLNLT